MFPSTEQVNFFIATLAKNDVNATEIHRLLSTAWGEKNVIKLRRIQVLAREFKDGERNQCTRKPGSGRPLEVRTSDNVERVKELVEEDSRISLTAICDQTGLERTSCYTILTRDLGRRSVCARWVPHVLTDSMKIRRVDGAQVILQQIQETVVVIDEKWLYSDPLPPKENNRAWVEPGGDRPRQSRRIIADKKFHIIVAINFRGDHYFEILKQGETVKAHRYIEFLERLQENHNGSELTIMHDNARPHTAKMTEQFLVSAGIQRIPQPPYSPDMNLLDRFIFRNMETRRSHKSFKTESEVRVFLNEFLNDQTRVMLQNELLHFRQELQEIIDAEGDYL